MSNGILDRKLKLNCPYCGKGEVSVSLRQILNREEFSCSSCAIHFTGDTQPNWMDRCQENDLAVYYRCIYEGKPLPENLAEQTIQLISEAPELRDLFPNGSFSKRLLSLLPIIDVQRGIPVDDWKVVLRYIADSGDSVPESLQTALIQNREAIFLRCPYKEDARFRGAAANAEELMSDRVFFHFVKYYHWEYHVDPDRIKPQYLYQILCECPEQISVDTWAKLEITAREMLFFVSMPEPRWQNFQTYLHEDSSLRTYYKYLTGHKAGDESDSELTQAFARADWDGDQWCELISIDPFFASCCRWNKVFTAVERGHGDVLKKKTVQPKKVLQYAAFSSQHMHGLEYAQYVRLLKLLNWEKYADISFIPRFDYLALLPENPQLLRVTGQSPITVDEALDLLQKHPEMYPALEYRFSTAADKKRLLQLNSPRVLQQIRPGLSDVLLGKHYDLDAFKLEISQFRFTVLETVIWAVALSLLLFMPAIREISHQSPVRLGFGLFCTFLIFGLIRCADHRFFGVIPKTGYKLILGILLPLPMLLFLYTSLLLTSVPSGGWLFLTVMLLTWIIEFFFYSIGKKKGKHYNVETLGQLLLIAVLFCLPGLLLNLFVVKNQLCGDIQSICQQTALGAAVLPQESQTAEEKKKDESAVASDEEKTEESALKSNIDVAADEDDSEEVKSDPEAELKALYDFMEKPEPLTEEEKKEHAIQARNLFTQKRIKEAGYHAVRTDLDDPDNLFLLAEIFASKEYRDWRSALRLYYMASLKGHSESKLRIGILMMDGRSGKKGVPINAKLAIKYLLPMAESGNMEAQYRMALAYRSGFGVEKNTAASFAWCEKAALQGYVVAERILGIYYYDGYGVDKDYKKAYYWIDKAVKSDDPDAMFMKSYMLKKGHGVKKDELAAEALRIQALKGGSEEAARGQRLFKP